MNKIKEIAQWFTSVKAPDLTDKVNKAVEDIENGSPLEGNYKKLFGFMLFSYSMNKGPLYFIVVEELAERIGVSEELKEYANDWINHSQKTKSTQP